MAPPNPKNIVLAIVTRIVEIPDTRWATLAQVLARSAEAQLDEATVRRALDQLLEEGRLYRKGGPDTYQLVPR